MFEGKVVLITGASTGIGSSFALEMGRLGAKVVVNYNASRNQAEQVVAKIQEKGGMAIAIQADVSKANQVKSLFQQTLATYGQIDFLVNNAGALIERKKVDEMTEDYWDKMMEVNLKSVFLCSKEVIAHFKERKQGKILNVTSISARNGGGNGSVAYSAAKGAVSTMTRGLAKELVSYNVTVNGVAPGIIATPFHDRFTPPDIREKSLQTIPMGREGMPEEVVGAMVFLLSDAANYITGEIIEINGGQLMD